jgi:hypothetical protein
MYQPIKDGQFYRALLSKRQAVKAIIELAEVVMPCGVLSLHSNTYGGDNNNWSLIRLINRIKQLKIDSDEYHKLIKSLKIAVKE